MLFLGTQGVQLRNARFQNAFGAAHSIIGIAEYGHNGVADEFIDIAIAFAGNHVADAKDVVQKLHCGLRSAMFAKSCKIHDIQVEHADIHDAGLAQVAFTADAALDIAEGGAGHIFFDEAIEFLLHDAIFFLMRDIAEDLDGSHHFSGFIPHHGDIGFHGKAPALLGFGINFDAGVATGAEGNKDGTGSAAKQHAIFIDMVQNVVPAAFADHFCSAVAGHACCGIVPKEDFPFRIYHIDAVIEAVHDAYQFRIRIVQVFKKLHRSSLANSLWSSF